MSTVPLPPRPSYYIRIFVISLVIIVACLLGLLFGVQMEASVPATGILQAQDQQNLRASVSGLAKLGWYEGMVPNGSAAQVPFRVDAAGTGLARLADGKWLKIEDHRVSDEVNLKNVEKKFHRLQPGDHVWPGQPLARIDIDPLNGLSPLQMLKQLNGPILNGDKEQWTAPQTHDLWQVLKIHVEDNAPVHVGTLLVTLAPIHPKSHQPLNVIANLLINEEHIQEMEEGQDVHLYSNVYNSRLHGHAEAKLLRIHPLGETQADGKICFHAVAAVTHSPFPLRLGSSVTAKIVLGKKTVYRLILEH